MIFGKGKRTISESHIYINNVKLEQVTDTKFLGVFIDDKLNCHKQIQHVQTKIAKSVSIMYRVKYLLDEAALLTLYSSLVLPYLSYCVEIWGNTYVTNLKSIIILQKRAVRIIGKAEFKSHTSPLFYKFRLLKMVDIVKLNTCIVVYKPYYSLLNSRLAKLFIRSNSSTRQGNKFYVQFKRTRLKSFSISCCGVKLWNDLDNILTNLKSITLFKSHLKRSFVEAYNSV
jgi:hypothetical protein